jgi:hypothetical protein
LIVYFVVVRGVEGLVKEEVAEWGVELNQEPVHPATVFVLSVVIRQNML